MYVCIEQNSINIKQMYYKMKQETIPKSGYNFTEAYNALSRANQRLLRDKITEKLKIGRCSFYNRMKGVVPAYPDFLIIKDAFSEFGINKVFSYENETESTGKTNS